ncbi:MAG: phage tail tape measure protein, partial [Shinella sp.]
MGKLSANLVVSLKDDTSAGARGVKRSLTEIERAERNLALARRNSRLSRVDKAEDALQLARDREAMQLEHERQALADRRHRSMSMALNGAAIATTALGYAAAKSYSEFAGVERQIGRIALNADKSASIVGPTIVKLQNVAQDTAMSFEDVSSGLETLVASGRSLDDSMAFLPSVAMTAQASGAAISDIALSADALAGSMKIGASDMQRAFDILVAGGKAGKFELKDMAQYLPSLLPAFSALGYEGTEGMQKIVAMLQVVRNQAGSSAEAATYLGNVFQKMYSEETAKKFKKFGVDLPKALDKAKREGRDVLDVFLDMTTVATKGDLSKLTQLFTDAEMQKGIRALMMGRGQMEQFTRALGNVEGSALKDFNQIAEDSAAKIQRLSTLWGQFTTQVGAGVADAVNPVLEDVTRTITAAQARAEGRRMQGEFLESNREEHRRRYRAILRRKPENRNLSEDELQSKLSHGDIVSDGMFKEDTQSLGEGKFRTVYDRLNQMERALNLWEQYSEGRAKTSTGRQNMGRLGVSKFPDAIDPTGQLVDEKGRPTRKGFPKLTSNVPIPEGKPTRENRDLGWRYKDLANYGQGRAMATDELVDMMRQRSLVELQKSIQEEVSDYRAPPIDWLQFLFGKAADDGFSFREHNGIDLRPSGTSEKSATPEAMKGSGRGILDGLD